jgi:hypothetical protein
VNRESGFGPAQAREDITKHEIPWLIVRKSASMERAFMSALDSDAELAKMVQQDYEPIVELKSYVIYRRK